MKKIACILLAASCLLLLACSDTSAETATYYYCRDEFAYGTQDGVIAPEQRDISGHVGDLQYLLSMYLVGPHDESLTSPFPGRTKLLSVRFQEDTVILEITGCSDLLAESQFTLGCACLAMTCLELTDAQYVTIVSADQKVTLSRENLLLFDSANLTVSATEESQ